MNICEECNGEGCKVCKHKTPVIYATREQLLARREEILYTLNITHKQWIAIVMTDTYVGDQWLYREEMDSIDFLLGDDDGN